MKKMKIDHTLSGAALRRGRARLGETQDEFAERVKMQPATLAAAESGRRRFPITRIGLLPPDIASEVRQAMIDEFQIVLDTELARTRRTGGKMRRGRQRTLVPAEEPGVT